MKKIIYSLFILQFLSLIWKGNGNEAMAQTELRYEHYTIENGMSSNWTTSVKQDTNGFLWVGTMYGLNCYNGYEFTSYYKQENDKNSLSDNSISGLLVDKSGTLWIATNKGLNKYLRASNTFQRFFFQDQNKIESLMIISITEAPDGNLWLGTDKGIRILNPKTNKTSTPEIKEVALKRFVEEGIAGIFFDSKQNVWLGSSLRGGFRIMDRKTFKPVLFTSSAKNSWFNGKLVTKFYEDKIGIIWILSGNGLFSYDNVTNICKRFTRSDAPNDTISYRPSSIIENKLGEIWVGLTPTFPFYTGIAKVDYNASTFRVYPYVDNDDRGLAWIYATCVFQDKSGIYWVGTTRGLDKMDPMCQQFKLYQQNPNLKYSQFNNIYSIVKDDSIVWLGTDGKGLIKYNTKSKKFAPIQIDKIKNSDEFFSILLLKDKTLLLGSIIGLYLYNPELNKIELLIKSPVSKGYGRSDVSSIIKGEGDEVWIGFDGGGVMRYNLKTKQQKLYRNDEKDTTTLCSNRVNVLYRDRQGIIWIGTADGVNSIGGSSGKGLDRFNAASETFTHFAHNINESTSISNNNVSSIIEDLNGALWVGTRYGGLNKLDKSTGKFKRYNKNYGLSSTLISSIQVDEANNIWIGSYVNGISCLNPKTEEIKLFDVSDGLQNSRFNPQASFKASDGELFFGGVSGFNSFYPAKLKYNTTAPNVLITSIKINNEDYKSDTAVYGISQLKLNYQQSDLQFDFVAMNFSQTYKNKYAYQLVGYDKDWIQCGTVRSAKYTNLDAGNYTFKVKACNNDGVWNETGTFISISIAPPWWKTWWAYTLYLLLFLAVLRAFSMFRERRLKTEKENLEVEVIKRTTELEESLSNLKSTQTQLIQAEKMASLGELTAGIAHEIQNPLNFVNNFSELSNELIDEMNVELEKGDFEEARTIAIDIKQNLEKINHHGKRADAIVKGMLQHSRSSSGVKELTDINALCDEYLRLCYHGLRAKDKSFNATMKTDFDQSIGKINIIPQDIGRVVLNLLTNAFYASTERSRSAVDEMKNEDILAYEPTVSISTKMLVDKVEIKISDNGNGIPQNIIDKIFQPFFTTKPTGQGTGLGLSLSYDIVTKGHGGELKVETKEGEGTTFIIQLPIVSITD